VNRMLLTAAADAAGHDDRTGWGLVDPLRAVTARLPADAPAPGGAPASVPAKPVPVAHTAAAAHNPGHRAGYLALGGLAVAAVIGFGAAALRQGQRRRWRPERARIDWSS